ncbi:MAG: family 10 glycosylhydrolase [Saprospiraceae bacterium]|nr:family 10 glycosylhydrolase [Saprospiraceae bacterium]
MYVVTWNRGYTLYPSQIMADQFGILIDPALAGRDPLAELIELAHKRNIEVIAWFEFGFASSYQDTTGGHLIQRNPNWAARDMHGNLVSKNGFQWLNAFDFEVQNFIQSLMEEVVQNYDVDGIQGDDRLPAVPSTSGYDSLTVSQYRAAHQGQFPPANPKDTLWVEWRAQQLIIFMQNLSQDLRALDPDLTLFFSPSIYPWSKFEYLQDWPTWVREGWIDEIIPQIYRYDIAAYQKELDKILGSQVSKENHHLIFPEVLLKVGDYYAPDRLLHQMIEANRNAGLKGEIFFFYEGILPRKEFFLQYSIDTNNQD